MVRYAVAFKVETIVLSKWRWGKAAVPRLVNASSANNDAELARMQKGIFGKVSTERPSYVEIPTKSTRALSGQ
jgi:hypothetical protein